MGVRRMIMLLFEAERRQAYQIALIIDTTWPPVLASIASRSFFLIGELLLGKLSETVVVVGNAPHDRPGFFVGHLIGNRASFLCTKAPMVRLPHELSGWHGLWTTKSSLEQRSIYSWVCCPIVDNP